VEEEKLKEVQEKKTNEKVKPLPEATNIQTERFLQFQASYDSCDTLEEIKKV
jgi:hypothetical protein